MASRKRPRPAVDTFFMTFILIGTFKSARNALPLAAFCCY